MAAEIRAVTALSCGTQHSAAITAVRHSVPSLWLSLLCLSLSPSVPQSLCVSCSSSSFCCHWNFCTECILSNMASLMMRVNVLQDGLLLLWGGGPAMGVGVPAVLRPEPVQLPPSVSHPTLLAVGVSCGPMHTLLLTGLTPTAHQTADQPVQLPPAEAAAADVDAAAAPSHSNYPAVETSTTGTQTDQVSAASVDQHSTALAVDNEPPPVDWKGGLATVMDRVAELQVERSRVDCARWGGQVSHSVSLCTVSVAQSVAQCVAQSVCCRLRTCCSRSWPRSTAT